MNEFTVNTDVLLLAVLTTITAVSYLIAINSIGVTKMSISFLIATVILTADIFMIVSYASGKKSESIELKYKERLKEEKASLQKKVIQNSVNNEEIKEKSLKSDEALKVEVYVNRLYKLANELSGINLRDYTLSIDDKISKATRLKRVAEQERQKYLRLKPTLTYIRESAIEDAANNIVKAALYCKLYYTAEDGEQEAVRERVMRSGAKAAKRELETVKSKLERMK